MNLVLESAHQLLVMGFAFAIAFVIVVWLIRNLGPLAVDALVKWNDKRFAGWPGPRPSFRVGKDLDKNLFFVERNVGHKWQIVRHDGEGRYFVNSDEGEVYYMPTQEEATSFAESQVASWKNAYHAWKAKKGKVNAVRAPKIYK